MSVVSRLLCGALQLLTQYVCMSYLSRQGQRGTSESEELPPLQVLRGALFLPSDAGDYVVPGTEPLIDVSIGKNIYVR
jgi:hypothetical protein